MILVLILSAIILIVHNRGILYSIGIGSVSTYKFIYVNTYDYPNMTQQPAAVSWSFNDPLGSISGICQTQNELFDLGYPVIQMNAPYANGQYPNIPTYTDSNISLCAISLPSTLLSQYDTEKGTFNFSAVGTNGINSKSYYLNLQLQSLYSAQQSQNYPVLVTIPLMSPVKPNNSETLNTSTTSSSTSINNNSTSEPIEINNQSNYTAPVITPTPVPENDYPSQPNIFVQIIDALQEAIKGFINYILSL